MVLEPVRCPVCHGIHVNKYGKTEDGKQRYICRNKTCSGKTFIREYSELVRLTVENDDITDVSADAACGVPLNNIAALAFAMLAGKVYVNVHSTAFPAGVIRGQLLLGIE